MNKTSDTLLALLARGSFALDLAYGARPVARLVAACEVALLLALLWILFLPAPVHPQNLDASPVVILTPEEKVLLERRGITIESLAPKDDGREAVTGKQGAGYTPRTRTSLWHQWPFSAIPRPPRTALGDLTADPWAPCFDLTGGFSVAACAAARPAIMAAHVARYGRGPGVVKAGDFECWRLPDCAENRSTFRGLFLQTLALSCGHAEVARAAPSVAAACSAGVWTMDRFSPKEQEDAAAFEAEKLTDAARCILGLPAVFGNTCLAGSPPAPPPPAPPVPPVTPPPVIPPSPASGVPVLTMVASPLLRVGQKSTIALDIDFATLAVGVSEVVKWDFGPCKVAVVGGEDPLRLVVEPLEVGPCRVSATAKIWYDECRSWFGRWCKHGAVRMFNVLPAMTAPQPVPPVVPPVVGACPDGYKDTGGLICPPGGGGCWVHCFKQ